MKTGAPDELPRLPALIVCDEPTGGLKIAALTLLDRLLVTLHRAGAVPITVVGRDNPLILKRTNALRIPVQFLPAAPVRESTTLVARSNLLVQVADVRGLLQQGGRLATADGKPLPIGVVPPGTAPWETVLDRLPMRAATGVGFCVMDPATARQAERALWASLKSSTDGFVDVMFNRPCGRLLSKILSHTPVSPNAVSLGSIAIGLAAAALFTSTSHRALILAAMLFQVSAIVDCVDGDLARVLFKESPLGKWLDLAGDQVVHVAVFAAIAIGLARSGEGSVALWLGLSAVLGTVLSFAVVVRGMLQPSDDRSRLLQKLIDAATNRDFSVLVLALACVHRLEWFLWLSAIGSHLFWMTALALQFGPRPKQRSRNRSEAAEDAPGLQRQGNPGAMKMFWKLLALLAGLALFGWYLSRADLRSVGEVLGRLGWLAPVILVPYVLVYVVDCLGWRFSFPPGMKISFARLFRIRWAGESVNNVLPSAYVGGEAVKVYLLRKHGVPAQTGMSSAVVSKSAQSVAQLFFILLAAVAFLQLAGDQPGLRAGMMLVLGAGVLALTGLFWMQRRGLFGSFLAVANALHLKLGFLAKRRAKILEVDQTITGFYRGHRERFGASTGIYLGGWLLDTLEIYLVAHLLGMPIAWKQALAVEAFTSVAKVLGMWVPGALGVQESSIVMLGRLAGLPDSLSVTYALLRRARELLFALVGWLFLYGQEIRLRTQRAAVVPTATGLNLKNNPKPQMNPDGSR